MLRSTRTVWFLVVACGCGHGSADSPELKAMLKQADEKVAAAAVDDAIQILTKAARQFPTANEPLVALANAYAKSGRDNDAVSVLDQLSKVAPADWRAPLGRAMIYSRRNQYATAVNEFESALKLGAPEDGCRLELAIALGRTNEYQRAIALFTKEILAGGADRTTAMFNRAIALRAQKDYAAAREDLLAVLAQSPEHVGALRVAAELFLVDDPAIKDLRRALEMATRIRDLDPKDAYALRVAAQAYYENGDPETAMRLVDKGLDLASPVDRREMQQEYLRYKFEAGPQASPPASEVKAPQAGAKSGGTSRSD
ncbi:MAG: tetratricopeptide repeat protein [Planctomycetota bacterium]